MCLRSEPIPERDPDRATGLQAVELRSVATCARLLHAPCQVGEIARVEADGRAEVDRRQLTALDEALDGPRVNVQQPGRFTRRQQPGGAR
jgi:hypothetical protein